MKVAEDGYKRLQLSYEEEENISSKVGMAWGDSCYTRYRMNIYMYDGNKYERPYPQGKHGIEWSHRRTVVFNRVDMHRIECDRGGGEFSEKLRVGINDIHKLVIVLVV